jgi:hypothetical protein
MTGSCLLSNFKNDSLKNIPVAFSFYSSVACHILGIHFGRTSINEVFWGNTRALPKEVRIEATLTPASQHRARPRTASRGAN